MVHLIFIVSVVRFLCLCSCSHCDTQAPASPAADNVTSCQQIGPGIIAFRQQIGIARGRRCGDKRNWDWAIFWNKPVAVVWLRNKMKG
jgi:hypothetical protein